MLDRARVLSLPERISRLDQLAHNLWWSWHPQARELFRYLDYSLWKKTNHNPVKELREVSPERLRTVIADPAFLSLYDSVTDAFDSDLSAEKTWFAQEYPGRLPGPVAFFSAEFAFHNSLPIYAGGLGVLAGDICKEASDLGLPLAGIGLLYPQGYFSQHISADGCQVEVYEPVNLDEAPIEPVLSPDGRRVLIEMPLDNTSVRVAGWRIGVGRTAVYLLDTDIEENTPENRELTANLYTPDQGRRIQQEMILGIGGVRFLRALGIQPAIWHSNEGHTAFMTLERIREEVGRGATFSEAVDKVRSNTVFTTHTPLPAGHDAFPAHLMEQYFHRYWDSLGIDRNRFMELGRLDGSGDHFNMAALALKMSGQSNGVSRLHGVVARQMWQALWPQVKPEEVPISHVTNGIHVPTWLAPEMGRLYEKYLGRDWLQKQDDITLWEGVKNIPDAELWSVVQQLKRKLLGEMSERARRSLADGDMALSHVLAAGALLDPEVLTIGFVRRFAEYKRPVLIFQEIERLKRIVNNPFRPVQIIFAGKSHPADGWSKSLIQQVYSLVRDRQFEGRLAFVEDYDMHMAHYLVQGVDLWLNNPRRLQEACGTSGMKASLNGVPHLSILDGWWYEGYNGANGWAIGDSQQTDSNEREKTDADDLYRILEEKVVPLYYERDGEGIPGGWIKVLKEAIRSVVPLFCASRMLKEYTCKIYMKGIST